jgi:alpha-L-fucosidase
MFDTKTTDFNIMNTSYKKDITKEIVESFREKGIVPGIYFSPYDFLWNYKKGNEMHFATHEVLPKNNPKLMQYNQEQLKEIMTNYGDIGLVFFDGPPEGLKEMIWNIQKDTLVTRGEMPTPEITIPDNVMDYAWEACYFMGESWGYRPYGDALKTPLELIELLIKIRAMGGNLLLNVTPDVCGIIPKEQQDILREIGLFLFFNKEAIYKVRPWRVVNEKNIWYTKAKEANTVYAFVTGEAWNYGYDYKKDMEVWHSVTLKGVKATNDTQIELVGQTGRVLEHATKVNPKTKWHQDKEGIHIEAMLCYRPYDNRKWPYPVAIRITNAE